MGGERNRRSFAQIWAERPVSTGPFHYSPDDRHSDGQGMTVSVARRTPWSSTTRPVDRPAGSVYLDAPPAIRPATTTVSRAERLRAAGAALLAAVGIVALTAAGGLAALGVVADDLTLTADATEAALDDPTAQRELAAELAAAIERDLAEAGATDAATALGIDVGAESQRVAEAAVADPVVRAEMIAVAVAAHEHVFVDPTHRLDLDELSLAIRAVAERDSPQLAEMLPASARLTSLDADSLPDLTGAVAVADGVMAIAVLLALALPAALLLHPHHHRVVGWTGRWMLLLGLVAAALAVGLPSLARELTGWVAAEAAVRGVSLRLLAPAALAGIVGAGFVTAAGVAGRRADGRTIDEGAAHALGVREPEPLARQASPHLDLARRGLVDADRPLTNI